MLYCIRTDMAILHVENLRKSYAARTLFDGVSFEIQPNERVGLIGVNGCGKSTLMNILLGKESADAGFVGLATGVKMTCVEQQPQLDAAQSLYAFTLEAHRTLLDVEAELSRLQQRLESETEQRERLIARQAVLLEQFDRGGGATFRAMTRSALLGLGFTESELSRSVTQFSGGQISKAMLARAILTASDLLLLDEPTNNLDVVAIRWLEDYLKQYKGAVLVVSHDRAFLDAMVTRMLELTCGRIDESIGNYTRYMELKLNARELAKKQYLRQQKEIKRIEGIIDQQRRWNQARNYVTIASKEKQIARIKSEMEAPDRDEKSLSFHFPTPSPTGNDVILLKELAKSYGAQTVFSDASVLIKRGECVCIIGANGCGKTTLLKLLVGEELPTSGVMKLGAGVRIGYYAQHTRDLNDDNTVIGELDAAFPRIEQNQLRGALGMFLFPNDDIYKRIGSLSGGEKARIQLLKLVLSGANVLLLDEPTNHLDIASAEMLEKAIERFEGTTVIVSHDRYLVNRLADRVLILTEHGFAEQTDESEDMFARITAPSVARSKTAKPADNFYLRQKARSAALLSARQAVRKAEQDIEANEAAIAARQAEMEQAQTAGDYNAMQKACQHMTALSEIENTLYERLTAAEAAQRQAEEESE